MKKWLIGILILILILLSFTYFYIPNTISLRSTVSFPVNPQGFHRSVMNEANWAKWWPGEKKDGHFYLNDRRYSMIDKKTSALVIEVVTDNLTDSSLLNIFYSGGDSITVSWEGEIASSSSPFLRIGQFLSAKKIKKDLDLILKHMRAFYAKQENTYGIDIKHEKVVDSTLLQNFAVANGYPTTEFIYRLIDELQQYASNQSAKQTGYPMLNISTEDSLQYFTKVAIPVDKKLKPSGNMAYRWMLGGGNILVTEVKGGPAAIQNAFEKLEEYVNDHKRIPPAIPFQSLITDRRQEKDTSKWVTKVYYPVM